MSEPIVYEIDLNKKYVIQSNIKLSEEAYAKIKIAIREWMEGDCPFLFISGDLKLVKVSE